MADEQNQDQTEQVNEVLEGTDELSLLKARAKQMGISFSNNIKLETLREKINEKLLADDAETPVDEDDDAELSPAAKQAKFRKELLASQMKLVRLRITNLDPKKKDLPGEIFTVANEYIGTVRKYVPYGEVTDEGYHVPFVIYQELESRRFQNIRTIKDRRTGHTRTETSWAKEFALEVLPALTKEELEDLARAQIAAGSVTGSADQFMA